MRSKRSRASTYTFASLRRGRCHAARAKPNASWINGTRAPDETPSTFTIPRKPTRRASSPDSSTGGRRYQYSHALARRHRAVRHLAVDRARLAESEDRPGESWHCREGDGGRRG